MVACLYPVATLLVLTCARYSITWLVTVCATIATTIGESLAVDACLKDMLMAHGRWPVSGQSDVNLYIPTTNSSNK